MTGTFTFCQLLIKLNLQMQRHHLFISSFMIWSWTQTESPLWWMSKKGIPWGFFSFFVLFFVWSGIFASNFVSSTKDAFSKPLCWNPYFLDLKSTSAFWKDGAPLENVHLSGAINMNHCQANASRSESCLF